MRSPIHKARLISDDGISALCYDPPRPIPVDRESWITSDALNDEVTCGPCRRVLGIDQEPSLSSLAADAVYICSDNYRFMADLIEFNIEREAVGSEPIDADDYARAMRDFTNFESVLHQVLDKMRERMKPARSWGWPDEIE